MKKTVLIILGSFAIMMASVVVISSCKKDKSEETKDTASVSALLVTDLHHSDCLNSGVEKRDTVGGWVTIERRGSNIYFEWPDCISDCEIDSFAIRSNIIQDTLEIDVRSYGQGTNCTCEYNVDAIINNVPAKRFFVKVYGGIMIGGRNMRGELLYSKWMNLQ